MSKRSRRRPKPRPKQAEETPRARSREPWLKMRTGLIAVTIASLALAIFVAWQVFPSGGLSQALLYGGGFGGSIWIVFYLTFRLNSWFKRR